MSFLKDHFTDLEKQIIQDYFGNPNQILSDIGKTHKVSQGRVSKLITRFLKLNNEARQEILNK